MMGEENRNDDDRSMTAFLDVSLWELLGAIWGLLGGSSGRFWSLLGVFGLSLGPWGSSCSHLGGHRSKRRGPCCSRARKVASWDPVGTLLGRSLRPLGPSWGSSGPLLRLS